MVVKQNVLTPELFLKLYTSVGWEPPGIDQVRAAFEHTDHKLKLPGQIF